MSQTQALQVTWTDDTPKFLDAKRKEAESLTARLATLAIDTQEQADQLSEAMNNLAGARKEVEGRLAALLRPHLDAEKALRVAINPTISYLGDVIDATKAVWLKWHQEQDRKAAESRKALEAAQRAAAPPAIPGAAALRAIVAGQAPPPGTPGGTPPSSPPGPAGRPPTGLIGSPLGFTRVAEVLPAVIPPRASATSSGSTGTRKTWDVEVVDLAAVALDAPELLELKKRPAMYERERRVALLNAKGGHISEESQQEAGRLVKGLRYKQVEGAVNRPTR